MASPFLVCILRLTLEWCFRLQVLVQQHHRAYFGPPTQHCLLAIQCALTLALAFALALALAIVLPRLIHGPDPSSAFS